MLLFEFDPLEEKHKKVVEWKKKKQFSFGQRFSTLFSRFSFLVSRCFILHQIDVFRVKNCSLFNDFRWKKCNKFVSLEQWQWLVIFITKLFPNYCNLSKKKTLHFLLIRRNIDNCHLSKEFTINFSIKIID